MRRVRSYIQFHAEITMLSCEKGVYGLQQSMKEIKELKFQKSLRDTEVLTLTQRVNDYEVQVSDFIEENDELRKRLGITDKTSIDLSNIRNAKHLEMVYHSHASVGKTVFVILCC